MNDKTFMSKLVAIFDAAILVSLVINFDWQIYLTHNSDSAAGLVLVPIEFAVWLVKILFFGLLFLNLALGIYLSVRDNIRFKKIIIFGSPVLALALTGEVYLWYTSFFALIKDSFVAKYVDFLWLFQLASQNGTGIGPKSEFGLSNFGSNSTGYFLIYLIIAIYLVEKYFLKSLRVHFKLPIIPLILVGILIVVPSSGTLHQHEFVKQTEWKILQTKLTWPEALRQCESLGTHWGLPSNRELALFLNSKSHEFQDGAAWTSSLADNGEFAISVDLVGRKSGSWHYNSDFNRNEAFCEKDDRPNQKYFSDFFTDRKAFFCRQFTSPILHISIKTMLATKHGSEAWKETNLPTLCINQNNPYGVVATHHDYWKEVEFHSYSEYEAFIKNKCNDHPAAVSCELYFGRTGDTLKLNNSFEAQCDNHVSDACFKLMIKAQKENQTKKVWDITLKICQFGKAVQCGDSARVAVFSGNPQVASELYQKYCEKLDPTEITKCLAPYEASLAVSKELETLFNELRARKMISNYVYFSEVLNETKNNCDQKKDAGSCYVVGRYMQQARQGDLAKSYFHLGCINHDVRSCKYE